MLAVQMYGVPPDGCATDKGSNKGEATEGVILEDIYPSASALFACFSVEQNNSLQEVQMLYQQLIVRVFRIELPSKKKKKKRLWNEC